MVNPEKKGWLADLMQHVAGGEDFISERLSSGFEQGVYRLLQPTGLLYGHPARFINPPDASANIEDLHDRMKRLVAESYLCFGFHVLSSDRMVDPADVAEKWAGSVSGYHSENAQRPKERVAKHVSNVRSAERVFDRLVMIQNRRGAPWTAFFHNSFLFVDLVFFLKWLNASLGSDRDGIRSEAGSFRLVMLKVIAAVAHSDCGVGKEETAMFNHFLASAGLSVADRLTAQAFFKEGLSLKDVEVSGSMPWLLRKYLLEIALLTAWSDGDLSRPEKEFVRTLGRRAGLSREDQEASLVAVETFVLEHWDDLEYLRGRASHAVIRKHWLGRMKKAVTKYRAQLAQEISESRELVALLRKSTREELSAEEKEKVREQLIDILKTIPSFALFFLPGSILTLPLLFKILPKEFLLPSAFQDKD